MVMVKKAAHKELHDPFAHYVRGVLHCSEHKFTFTAYRQPYVELNEKTWATETAFNADYRRTIARKYAFEAPIREH